MTAIAAVDTGAVGHQGQGRGAAGLRAARRSLRAPAPWCTGTPAAATSDGERGRPLHRPRATRRSARSPRPRAGRRPMASPRNALSTSPPTPAADREQEWSTDALSRPRAEDHDGCATRRLRHPPAARCPPPAFADRGRPARARRSSRTGCSGSRILCRPNTSRLPPDPSAYDDADRRRRSVQLILDCQLLITEQLIDYVRATVVHAGGITHLRRISPSPTSTGTHRVARRQPTSRRSAGGGPPFRPQRAQLRHPGVHRRTPPETDAVFPHAYSFADGHLHPGPRPGTASTSTRRGRRATPTSRGYLPVNRRRDGSMHDW